MLNGKCSVCGKETDVQVACSAYGAFSHAYCKECFGKGLEPYTDVVITIACAGHFPDDINSTFVDDVRRMLPLWGKTEEEFVRDVDKFIDDMNTYMKDREAKQ